LIAQFKNKLAFSFGLSCFLFSRASSLTFSLSVSTGAASTFSSVATSAGASSETDDSDEGAAS